MADHQAELDEETRVEAS